MQNVVLQKQQRYVTSLDMAEDSTAVHKNSVFADL